MKMKICYALISFALLIVISNIISCNKKSKINAIYLPNREWKFQVKKSNTTKIDTLYLKILPYTDKSIEEFKWILFFADSNSSNYLIDTCKSTLTVEDYNNENYINITLPTNQYLRLNEAFPSPQLRLPVEIGYTNNFKKIVKISINDELRGSTITGKIIVVGKIYYDNPIVHDSCWVLDAFGNSKLGTLKARYFFHEKYGFVYFYYDFIKYQVEMNLISFI